MAKDYLFTTTFTFEGRRYKVRADSEKELITKMALKKRDLEDGRKKISRGMLVSDWSKEFLEVYVRQTVSKATFVNYLQIDRYLASQFCGRILADVKSIECQRIINNLSGKSASYVTKVRQYLFRLFDTAVDNGLIRENPARKLSMPKCQDGTHRALTDAERQLLLKVCEYHPAGLWVKTMLYTGIRPGETTLIQGRHIDREKCLLRIEGTKTKAAVRILPFPPELKFPEVGPFEYVFTNQKGEQLNKANIRRMWNAVLREVNIAAGCKVYRNQVMPPLWTAPDLTPYCLRHTFCTDLQAAGVPINVAKELMGHADISTTSRIYTHFSEEAFHSAAEKMAAFREQKEQKINSPTGHLAGHRG